MTPDSYTNSEQMLAVGDGHELYVHDWGKSDAMDTFFFLHGGPGSGCGDGHKDIFDPSTQRVIFFDQRGAGKSTPKGSLEANTTDKLVSDITAIADKLGIQQFTLVGGSWGSTLALAYALEHPERVRAMVLRGLFTGSKREVDFLMQGKFSNFFPEVWEAYQQRTPQQHRQDPSAYHVPRALGDEPTAAKESAYALAELEGSLTRLDERRVPAVFADYDPAGIRLETHYTSNGCFLPERFIQDNAGKLQMPIILIQGRYDMVCPPETAYELSKLLPNATLIWTLAGHSGNDRANFVATKTAIACLVSSGARQLESKS